MSDWRVEPLAQDFSIVIESPDPAAISTYSPGLAVCPSGRLVATMDFGKTAPEYARRNGLEPWRCRGRIFVSDDKGKTWTAKADVPFQHERPFVAGDSLYVLGHAGDLAIVRSDDWGETWSPPARLTEGESWHQAPCNVHYANGCLYLVMEKNSARRVRGWDVSELAPVLMRGRIGADLTRPENWTFASELPFCKAVPDTQLDWIGAPFFPAMYPEPYTETPNRSCAPIGWLETNVVQFSDPDHVWHDPTGRTFHLWMRAHTGATNLACVAKVVEDAGGAMATMLETAPSGKRMVYVPCPGGQMKFHILFDGQTGLYWLLSTQSTDSMRRIDRLPADRYSLPNNERRRLQLHFSRNCIDWCFAGLAAVGPVERASRHYASMAIDGEDLRILSRSGDERAKNAHDVNRITFHTIANFRRLAY